MIYHLLACASLYVFTPWRLINSFNCEDLLRFCQVIYTASPQALFITAVLIAAERFNAIYWPLNHQTISMRAWLVILTAKRLAFLLTFLLLHLTNIPLAQNAFICLYGLFLVMTISVLPQHQHLEKVSAKNCSSIFMSVFL